MQLSTVKVEQVESLNNVVVDFGENLNYKEIEQIVLDVFPNTFVNCGNIMGIHNNTNFCLYFKNISYLGNPHPIFKKRIQIPRTFKELHNYNLYKNTKTLLLGIYKYKETILFCDFDTKTYVEKKMNNSSALIDKPGKIWYYNEYFKGDYYV